MEWKTEEKLMCTVQVGKVCRSVSVETARGGASNIRRAAGETVLMYEVVHRSPISGLMPSHKGVAYASKESSTVMAG